ncbi:uncharacterized protein LOC135479521 [Liolophura sinensis]|uniref:uncharacterized protein LOC135479521 n=1 Tax=Liolophura sinensis TaxID=3198878 RepID=UPI0031588B64
MAGPVFKVDNLVNNLKELQQEKSCLEQKLNELRDKRRKLESLVATVKTKHAQVSDTNAKMMETLKVAQHKVMQTQTQANSLENSNTEKRATIANLNEKIENEKLLQLEQVQDFEKNLGTISADLNQARHFFTEDNLETEISGASEKIRDIDNKVMVSTSEVDNLSEELQKLSLRQSGTGDTDIYGVSLEERRQIWNMLQEENDSSLKCLDNLGNQLKDLTDHLQEEQCEELDDQSAGNNV